MSFYLSDDIFKMILKVRGREMRYDYDKKINKQNFNKVINEINEINDKFKSYISPNEMTHERACEFINSREIEGGDVNDYVGNGCLLCDVFMCDLKNKDYYNYNIKHNILLSDDVYDYDYNNYDYSDKRIYKYYDIFNYVMFISSLNDNNLI